VPLPAHAFDKTEIKVRYGERYVSQAVNKKFLGFPFGVYRGFTPATTAGSLVLRLEPDGITGTSLARAQSTTELVSVDIVIDAVVQLDFSDHDFGTEPTAYAMVRAAASLGGATSGEVFTRATGPADLTEQLLCVVTKPAADLEIAADPAAGPAVERDTPYAYAGAPMGYGFMASGAVEQISAAVAMVGEVEDSRTDLDDVYHDWDPLDVTPPPGVELGLADRIVADLQPDAIAGRLGLVYRVVRSNEHTTAIETSEVNVSSSFTETARLRLPVLTLDGGGSETQVGVVTDDDAEARNVCFVAEAGTNNRPVDNERRVAFGRLEYAQLDLTGTLTFSAVSATVTGNGTDFADPTQIQIGDSVQAPDGLHYTVINVVNPVTLTLDQIPTAGGVALSTLRRRWLLKLFTRSELGESPFSLAAGLTIRFFCGAWFGIGASVYDATLEMFEGGEDEPLPSAAPSIEGKVQMYPGLTGAKAGAIQNIQIRGAAVGSGVPVHSLGFDGAADAAGGVVDVTMTGETGDQGDQGTGTGPPGDPGTPGTGLSTSTLFNAVYFPGGGDAAHALTHSVNFGAPIKYLHGGPCFWQRSVAWPGGPVVYWWRGSDYFDITSVYRTGTSNEIGVVDDTYHATQWGGTFRGLYLNGAT